MTKTTGAWKDGAAVWNLRIEKTLKKSKFSFKMKVDFADSNKFAAFSVFPVENLQKWHDGTYGNKDIYESTLRTYDGDHRGYGVKLEGAGAAYPYKEGIIEILVDTDDMTITWREFDTGVVYLKAYNDRLDSRQWALGIKLVYENQQVQMIC